MRAASVVATVSAQLARLCLGIRLPASFAMADVVNLRIARKRLARKQAEDRAAERRLAHGASKAERDRAEADREKARRALDQHQIETGDRR